MTIRQAAGLEPMHLTIRLAGGHRVGNQITGIDLAAPGADRTVLWRATQSPGGWHYEVFMESRGHVRSTFFQDWFMLQPIDDRTVTPT